MYSFTGIYEKWKQPIGYFLPSDSLTSDTIRNILEDLINKLHNCDLVPKVIICDQAGCNRGLFTSMGVSHKQQDKTFIVRNGSKIHFMWDTPHLLKSARNMLLKYRIKVNKRLVDFQYVREVYHIEKFQFAKSTKLTKSHIYPNSMERMRVPLAAQTISGSVAGAVATHATFRYEIG